ncbi:S8 family serine peptidase [Paracidovorax citrulli]
MSDDIVQQLHPRLRLASNGSAAVNRMRAEFSQCFAAAPVPAAAQTRRRAPHAIALHPVLPGLERFAAGLAGAGTLPAPPGAVARPGQEAMPAADDVYSNVVVEIEPGDGDGAIAEPIVRAIAQMMPGASGASTRNAAAARRTGPVAAGPLLHRGNFIAATVPVASLRALAALPGVRYVHHSESLSMRLPLAGPVALQPSPRQVTVQDDPQRGEQVLIGIIDVGGFDFSHPDFIDANGRSRFLSIWDQGGDFRPPPAGFGYGSELTRERLDAALQVSREGGPPATELERQSQQEPGSHATHVASIAAGNSGLCPGARIAGVLISIEPPAGDYAARRWTFSDASRVLHAVEYLLRLAEREGLPLSINISLGTNGGPHDGANGTCRWLDAFLGMQGRAIAIAAGNAGQERPTDEDRFGWIMGRIHTSGRIASRGLTVEIEWTVVGDGIADFSENELEIWYGAQDRFTVAVQPPGSQHWYEVAPREYIENLRLADGTVLSVYNELYHPSNGDNYIGIYLSPYLDPQAYSPVAAGTWKVRLHGDEVRDGGFHAWIERDDPMELQRRRELAAYRFPSFFTEASNVDSHSINSLACARWVIGVANADVERARVHISSSQGPTRDGRFKPDICAPGTRIVAASGFAEPGGWVEMTGTSMASPYVCGVMGLMLSARPTLSAAQCQGILRRTARPLPSHDYAWRNDAGYGLIDPVAAIEEALAFDQRNERRETQQGATAPQRRRA